jgi:hydrocephalus-inducing protein
VTFDAKNAKVGPHVVKIPIWVKNGPMYTLIINANVTTPEIKLSRESIEFDRVLCGEKLTTFVRFENEKEVECAWHLVAKR